MNHLISPQQTLFAFLLVATILLATSCGTGEAKLFGTPIRQYADEVIEVSSEYSSPDWHAEEALGKEDVYPEYGDLEGTWASATKDGQREFLELGFDSAQTVTKIEIYETFSPGAIDTVYLRNGRNKWILVYAGVAAATGEEVSRIFTINVDPPVYGVNAIRIKLDSPAVPDWNEIDAVAITGKFPIVEGE